MSTEAKKLDKLNVHPTIYFEAHKMSIGRVSYWHTMDPKLTKGLITKRLINMSIVSFEIHEELIDPMWIKHVKVGSQNQLWFVKNKIYPDGLNGKQWSDDNWTTEEAGLMLNYVGGLVLRHPEIDGLYEPKYDGDSWFLRDQHNGNKIRGDLMVKMLNEVSIPHLKRMMEIAALA